MTGGDGIVYRRLRAPREHGATLIDPALARCGEVVAENRRLSSEVDCDLSGWNLRDLASRARADLLTGALVYVCDSGAGGEHAAREVIDFWAGVLQGHPVRIDAAAHDRQLAWTSHLPQAVASALAAALGREPSLTGAAFGTGLKDTTRLAASPVDMWVEILLQNRTAMDVPLAGMEAALGELRRLIAAHDREGLTAFLSAAAAFRRPLG